MNTPGLCADDLDTAEGRDGVRSQDPMEGAVSLLLSLSLMEERRQKKEERKRKKKKDK